MKMEQMKDVVDRILRDEPQSRDDDVYLIFRVWQETQDDGEPEIPQYIYKKLKNQYPDSITRIRRLFQQQGLYPATESIQLKRKKESISVATRINEINMENPIWITSEGKEYKIFELHTAHLEKLLKHLDEMGWSSEPEKQKISRWRDIVKEELDARYLKEMTESEYPG